MVFCGADTRCLPVASRRPLLAGPAVKLGHLLAALTAGVAAAPSLPFFPWWPLLALLAAGGWLGLARRSAWSLLLFFCLFGVALCQQRLSPSPAAQRLSRFAGGGPVAVEGRVLGTAPRTGGGGTVDVAAERVGSSGIAAPVEGGVRVYLDTPAPDLTVGAKVRFLARLRRPRRFGIPGESDYPRHLAAAGLMATAHLPDTAALAVSAAGDGGGWRGRLGRARLALGRFIDSQVPPEVAPLVRALVIGDKAGLTPPVRDLLGRGGIAHLFSISGLHLGLVAGLLYACGAWFCRRFETVLLWAPPRRWLPAALLPLLLAYLLLTGAALPTRRAFFAAVAGAWLLLSARRSAPLSLWTSVAFLLLCLEPLALFEPSFQLSFAGVLGILLFWPRCEPLLSRLPRWMRPLAGLGAVTLGATIATAPLVLWHFHLLAPAGLVTNLVAVAGVLTESGRALSASQFICSSPSTIPPGSSVMATCILLNLSQIRAGTYTGVIQITGKDELGNPLSSTTNVNLVVTTNYSHVYLPLSIRK